MVIKTTFNLTNIAFWIKDNYNKIICIGYSLNSKDLKNNQISFKDLGEWLNFGSFVTLPNL